MKIWDDQKKCFVPEEEKGIFPDWETACQYLKKKVREYLERPSEDGASIRQKMRKELAEMVK
jgi:hypothetical protein